MHVVIVQNEMEAFNIKMRQRWVDLLEDAVSNNMPDIAAICRRTIEGFDNRVWDENE